MTGELPPDMEKARAADSEDSEATTSLRAEVTENPTNTNEQKIMESHDATNDEVKDVYSIFSPAQKWYIVAMVSFAAFVSPTSANIYFPAINAIQKDLHVSATLINLTITSFMIFQGLAPSIFGDLADMGGRRPAYILAFVVYLGANIAIALQTSYPALFVLRCIQSSGSSGAVALGYGVIADISSHVERGQYMGYVGGCTMLGPALGPVIGGLLVQFLGWRAIFWFLAVVAASYLVLFALSVPETARNVVGNGSIPPQGWNMTLWRYIQHRKQRSARQKLTDQEKGEHKTTIKSPERKLRWPNPLKTLLVIREPDMALVLFYNALIYTAFYDLMASLPKLFQEIYHFNDLQIGLCYLPFGVGCALAGILNGRILDYNYKRVAKKIGFTIDKKRGDDLLKFPIERARLEVAWPFLTFGLICMICYGWVIQQRLSLAAPLVFMFFIGLCVNGTFTILSTLIVDLYPQSPSTATAANNLCRCFMGAAGTAVIDMMVGAMGPGWCFTFISLVCFAAMPMLWADVRFGPGWREKRWVRMSKST